MQFFPAFNQSELVDALSGTVIQGNGTAALGRSAANASLWGKQNTWGKTAIQKAGKGLNFAAALGDVREELKGLDLKEFNPNNTPGVAPGFVSTKDDRSQLKTRDLNYLESKLRKSGVDEDVLQSFMGGLYSGAELPAVGRIMGAARNMGKSGEALDEQEKIALSGFLRRIGYDTEEIADMEELSYRGKGLKALESVEKRIVQLTDPAFRENLSKQLVSAAEKLQGATEKLQGATEKFQGAAEKLQATAGDKQQNTPVLLTDVLHVTKEELSALVKTFNLSEKAGAQLMSVFGDKAEAEITARDFSKLFGNAKAELERDSAAFAKLREAAPGAIKDMLDNAKLASTSEASSDNRGSRKLERSEILIRDSATLANDDEESDGSPANRKSMLAELSAKADQGAAERNISENLRNARNTENSPQTARNADNGDAGNQRLGHDDNDDKGDRGNRREFSDALKQSNEKASSGTAESTTSAGREILAAKTEAAAGAIFSLAPQNAPAAGNDARAAVFHERIFEQVEQGILKNAADGSRQITLRLDPPDLGRLTLNLTVANGEVKALIRTEQTEVTRVVSEQVAALKASLEEQGFKVTSLEVETRPQSEPGMENWTSAEQHNKERELEAMASFVKLSRSRAKEGETLAQNMQNSDRPATISEAGLHLIA